MDDEADVSVGANGLELFSRSDGSPPHQFHDDVLGLAERGPTLHRNGRNVLMIPHDCSTGEAMRRLLWICLALAPTSCEPANVADANAPATEAPQGAVAAQKKPPIMHSACKLTGQTPRPLALAPAAQPAGSEHVVDKKTRTRQGFVKRTQPVLELDGRMPLTAVVATAAPLQLAYGDYVEVDYHVVRTPDGGNRQEVLAVRPATVPPRPHRTLFRASGDAGTLIILHDGRAMISLSDPIQLAPGDVERIMSALGEANVDTVPSIDTRWTSSMELSCTRSQLFPPDSPRLEKVREVAMDVLRDALRRDEYVLRYDRSAALTVEDWPLDRVDFFGREEQEPGEEVDPDPASPRLPKELSARILSYTNHYPERVVMFRHDGELFRLERETDDEQFEYTTFADLRAQPCESACLRLPNDLDLSSPDRAVSLTYDQLIEMGLEPRRGEQKLRDVWAVAKDRVLFGVRVIRKGAVEVSLSLP